MSLFLRPITAENRKEAEALETAPGQEGFVESVTECLQEADQVKCWRPVGIYTEKSELVGFAMYGYFWQYPPFGRVWLDRLLIDRRYQGRGYGKEAVELLLEQLWREYHRRKIYLSVYQENAAAIRLYQKFGFAFNGELDLHGESVMVCRFTKTMERRRDT